MIIVQCFDLALKVCLTDSLSTLLFFFFYLLADYCWLSAVKKMTNDRMETSGKYKNS